MNEDLPFERSWWIDKGRVIGGRFPGTPDPAESYRLLARLLDVGVRTVINLQVPEELGADGKPFPDYVAILKKLAAECGVEVEVHRFPIPDMGVPTSGQMERILGAIDRAVRMGHCTYVHCWGGHGRTGTVAGCWLVGGGAGCSEALALIERARQGDPHLARNPAPQTEDQRMFVQSWAHVRGDGGTRG